MKPLPFTGSAVALITPMDEHLAINFDKLGELIDFHLDQQTDALVVTATTGESATLSDREREQILSFTVDRVSRRIPVIAGVGSNCTDHACALSKRAQELGADALLHVTPYYNKASQQGLVAHFQCCAESASLPVILYNVPSRTGVNILPETYRQLSQIPNIVAVKEAGGNFSQIAKLLSYVKRSYISILATTTRFSPSSLWGERALFRCWPIFCPAISMNFVRAFSKAISLRHAPYSSAVLNLLRPCSPMSIPFRLSMP